MKSPLKWIVLPTIALGLGACKKPEEAKAPETTTPPAAETAAAPETSAETTTPAVKAPALSPEERAAKLGFVKHLPQDTEIVMAFHNGSKTADRIQATKLWKAIQAESGMGFMGAPGMDIEEQDMEEDIDPTESEQDATVEEAASDADSEPMGPAKLFSSEFTLALGKSGSAQTGNLVNLYRRINYFQFRSMAKAFVAAAQSGDFSELQSSMANTMGPELFKDMLADPESGVSLLEKLSMPPLYLAFKTSSADREAAAQQIQALTANLGMIGDMVEPIEVEKAGAKFSGNKIVGKKVSEMLNESRQMMEGMIDAAMIDRLVAAVATKDLVAVSGTLGDYVVLFVGNSTDDIQLTADLSQSLVATDSLAFADPYVTKDLAALTYGRKDMLDAASAGGAGLADIAEALRDGIAGSEGLGDTRDIESLLRLVEEREAALLKLTTNETGGMAVFFEDGLKIELHGGADNGAVDWKATNRLASLGASEDVVLFASTTSEAKYDEALRAYLEALMETGYAVTMKVAEVAGESEDFAQFAEMSKIFDTKFREDTVTMWEALSTDMGSGLGNESLFIMDLKGSMPPFPGIPQAVVDKSKFPRLTMLAPVTDRTKVSGSWEKINASATKMMGNISELTGQEIPMQKPISSERDGNTTWFFSMPFFNDEFLPSVTVGDKWFAASTSKNQALDLIGKASTANGGKTGVLFSMNFSALQAFAEETLKTLEENADDAGMEKEDLEKSLKFIEALADIDTLSVHARRENGELRSSIHLKTR